MVASSPKLGSDALLINDGGSLRTLSGDRPLPSVEEEAMHARPAPAAPRRLALRPTAAALVVPPPLYGSREILLHQNEMADRDGLDRVRDDADLLDLRREKKLVALPESERPHRRLSPAGKPPLLPPLDRRLPHRPQPATSTPASTPRSRSTPPSAPSPSSSASSAPTATPRPPPATPPRPHLTGQAVDIAKGGLSRTQIAWMRTYLQPLIDQGKIDVEEEFQQACFHISVYKSFLPTTASRVAIAAARQLPANPAPGGSDQ